jgi:hypothetical protein
MKGYLRAGLLSLGILGFSGMANGGTLTLYPDSPGVSGVVGNMTTASPGPNGSFQADAASGGGKSQIYVDPSLLFGHSITIGDIASMSYFTNKGGTGADPDWTLLLYTKPTGSSDTASWYHARLNSEPYFTQSTVASNTWHQWSTNDPTNPLRFYDAARSGTFGTYTDPTLSQIQSGTISWTSDSYATQTVELLSFQTGSAWASGFTGLLDGFNITLTDATTGDINFEAVPLPSSAWAGILLLGGLAAFKLRRKAIA